MEWRQCAFHIIRHGLQVLMQHLTDNDDGNLRNCISSSLWTCPRVKRAPDKNINQTTTNAVEFVDFLPSKNNQLSEKHKTHKFVYSIWNCSSKNFSSFYLMLHFLIVHILLNFKRSNRNGKNFYEIQTKFFYIICVQNHSFAHSWLYQCVNFNRVCSLHITSQF